MGNKECSATLTCASETDGQDEEKSYALPLSEGALYPLDITPTPKVVNYSVGAHTTQVIPYDYMNTPKSQPCGDFASDPYLGFGC